MIFSGKLKAPQEGAFCFSVNLFVYQSFPVSGLNNFAVAEVFFTFVLLFFDQVECEKHISCYLIRRGGRVA